MSCMTPSGQMTEQYTLPNIRDDYSRIEGHHRRQELHLGHPSEPRMKRPGEVQKQEGDTDEEYKCKYDTDLSKHTREFCAKIL